VDCTASRRSAATALPAGRLVGRTKDRKAVAGLLRTAGVVTVVGMGGVGKTRLAVQVAFDVMDDFPDGAWLVELAPLRDPANVPRAVAAALRIGEEPGRLIEDVVTEAVRPKALLLVLDNCEHLLDAVARFTETLTQHSPRLAVLATSREPLDVEGEAVWRLGPLPSDDAVRLFAERAALARPGFRLTGDNDADVADLVARLNGIPLAIELAAAALRDRSLATLRAGLSDRFSLLTSGRRTAPERHQTLRAALEWSLDLLGSDERRLLARLAAFASGATVEAASAVCGVAPLTPESVPPMLRRLIRASLLASGDEATDRWSMLESVRDLAALELRTSGEGDQLAARHRGWYTERVEALAGELGLRGHTERMRELAADHDNVRLAVDTAVAAADAVTALRLCTAMTPFWTSHGDWAEGCARLEAALKLTAGDSGLRAWRAR
jgi:predicted ATPase